MINSPKCAYAFVVSWFAGGTHGVRGKVGQVLKVWCRMQRYDGGRMVVRERS
jgi:hypothetical protein